MLDAPCKSCQTSRLAHPLACLPPQRKMPVATCPLLQATHRRLNAGCTDINQSPRGVGAKHLQPDGWQRYAPLASEDACILVPQTLVLAKKEADLTWAHTNVTSWHIRVLSNVPLQLGHEGLAEPATHVIGSR